MGKISECNAMANSIFESMGFSLKSDYEFRKLQINFI